ncbi:MAG: hypothetical protein AAGI03_01900 [Pseudomonadota bacterium]
MQYAMEAERHARLFGPKLEDSSVGRTRKCKVCGGWHRTDQPWPHNCREPAPPRSDLAAPQLAPGFHEHVHGAGGPDATYIGDRGAQREFMKREGLANWEPGIGKRPDWVAEAEHRESIRETIKKAEQISDETRDGLLHVEDVGKQTPDVDTKAPDIPVMKQGPDGK